MINFQGGEQLTVFSQEQLYTETRKQLLEEHKEAYIQLEKYRRKVGSLRMAIRGLSDHLGLPIPTEIEQSLAPKYKS
jgi:hypothetical protein